MMMMTRMLLVAVMGLASGCTIASAPPPQAAPTHWEFASFHAEMAGDFSAPVVLDVPTHYVWTTSQETISTSELSVIWEHLGATSDKVIGAQGEVEILLLTHLSSVGWSLEYFSFDTVRSQSREDLQTTYRYIFKRELLSGK